MTYLQDYGLDSPVRALALLVLSADDTGMGKMMDILHIQKVIRYFEYIAGKDEIDYSNYKMGGVSYELAENLETLVESGFIEKAGNCFTLSEMGKAAAEELSDTIPRGTMDSLSFAKRRLNHLTGDELMFFMYNVVPETRANSTEYPRLEKRRKRLIEGLILKGAIITDEEKRMFGLTDEEYETLAITQDQEFMDSIKKGCSDISAGRVKPLSELLAKHGLD